MSVLMEILSVGDFDVWMDSESHEWFSTGDHLWEGVLGVFRVSDTGVALERYWAPYILSMDSVQYRISGTAGGFCALSFGNVTLSPDLFSQLWPPPNFTDFTLKYYDGAVVHDITSGVLHLSEIRDSGISYEVYRDAYDQDFLPERVLYREDGVYTDAEPAPVPLVLGEVRHQHPARLPDVEEEGYVPEPTGPRFVDNEDGTITDFGLRVMWVADPHALPSNGGAGNWADAVDLCDTLIFAGYEDWRLPSRSELGKVSRENADWEEVWDLTIITTEFTLAESQYWTSASNPFAETDAVVVYLNATGNISYLPKTNADLVRTWPCRSLDGLPPGELPAHYFFCYWKAGITGTVGANWQVFDDGVNISTNVEYEDAEVFWLNARPVGEVTISGTGTLNRLTDVVTYAAGLMAVDVSTIVARDPSPILGHYWTQQTTALQAITTLCTSHTHMFWIDGENMLHLIDMFGYSAEYEYTDDHKLIDSVYTTNPAVSQFNTSWVEREAVEISAGRMIQERSVDLSFPTDRHYGEEQDVQVYQSDLDWAEVTLDNYSKVYASMNCSITIPLEGRLPEPGELWLLVDRTLHLPLSVKIHVRNVIYDIPNRKITIIGDGEITNYTRFYERVPTRVTQAYVEVGITMPPQARVTQTYTEVGIAPSNMQRGRITQAYVEAGIAPSNMQRGRITQAYVEAGVLV